MGGADGGQGVTLVVEELVRRGLDRRGVHGLDARDGLDGVQAAAEREHLSSELLADGGGSVGYGQVLDDHLLLGLLEELLVDLVGEVGDGSLHVEHQVVEGHGLAHRVDPEEAGVRVLGAECGDFLGHALLGALGDERVARELAAGHALLPGADHVLHHHEREAVRVGPAADGQRVGDVGVGHIVVAHADLRAGVDGLLEGDFLLAFGGDASEVGVCELDQLVVVDGPGAHDHHAVGGVVRLDVVFDHRLVHGVDVLSRAEDGASEGRTAVGGLVEAVEDDLLDFALNLLHFT
mmetsp:Transcript_8890/g.16348  ORF Transcript_8890/g.16348 Transcript_8890/m.16348 type:complete len:293 (+) Transcript_8890:324-1202(+)